MATVYLTFSAGERARLGTGALVAKASYARSETVTSSGTSAQSTFTAKDGEGVVKVFCDTAVVVNAGANPTASLATGVYIPAGQSEWVSVQPGQKIAVVDA